MRKNKINKTVSIFKEDNRLCKKFKKKNLPQIQQNQFFKFF